jgi:hypothetical protein
MALALVAAASGADDPVTLLDQEPFDAVTIRDGNRDVQLRTFRLEFPDGQIPENPRGNERLRLRLVDYPDEEYTVEWRHVKSIERFEQRLLRGARELTGEGRMGEAFSMFAHLYQHYPQTSGLDQAYLQYLSADVTDAFRSGQLDEALMVLDELQRRNPQQTGLQRALGHIVDQVLEKMMADGQYRRIYEWMELYEQRFGQAVVPALTRWRERLQIRAEELMRQAVELRDQDQPGDALRVAREAQACWPDAPGLAALIAAMAREHPVIHVGVRQPSPPAVFQWADNWASQRLMGLVQRPLVEIVDFTNEGAVYRTRLGKASMTNDRRQLSLELQETAAQLWSAQQISEAVVQMAQDPGRDRAHILQRSVAAVWPDGNARLQVDLSRPMLEGLALLNLPFPLANPYERPQQETPPQDSPVGDVAFVARHVPATAPREITERVIGSSYRAIDLLRAGQVDVIDRLWPFERASLQGEPGIEVGVYRVPSLHWLVVHTRQPILQRREFRRALVYGIDRSAILRDVFLGGMPADGCQVLSGPCPSGLAPDDPLGYGYDRDVQPRAYDPLLARTLVRLSVANTSEAKDPARQPPPRLVLACPDDHAMQQACRLIQTNLQRMGIECTTRWLEAGQHRPPDDEWDLLYVDLQVREPLSDLCRIFGPGGLVEQPGPFVSLALRQMGQAGDWTQARESLMNLHRWAHDDATIIPLWQMVDGFGYRTDVAGIGSRLMSLYQNVSDWQLRPGESQPTAAPWKEAGRS